MASFNDLLAAQAAPPSAVCSVALWRETLDPSDREQFDTATLNPNIRHATLWRVMKAMGYGQGATAVQRHRSGGCKCPASQKS